MVKWGQQSLETGGYLEIPGPGWALAEATTGKLRGGDGGGDWDGWEKHMEPNVGQIHNAIHAILGYIIRITHDITELTNHNHNKS